MNDQTKIRLQLVMDRFGKKLAAQQTGESEWVAAYQEACAKVLRPAMKDIGEMLARAGHPCEVRLDAEPDLRSIDLVVKPGGPAMEERWVRFFAHEDEQRGWQVIAEVWLSGSPPELTRFEHPRELTPEVVEQVLVDGIEQIFASAAAAHPGDR